MGQRDEQRADDSKAEDRLRNDVIGHVGRILAIDYGTVRIGLAISDRDQHFAGPYDNYTRRSPELDARYLKHVIDEERVRWLLVGLPVHLDGRENAKSQETRRFGHWLREQTGLPVGFYDERMTSLEAEQQLRSAKLTSKRRKQRRDMLAAQLLLAAFLESDRSAAPRAAQGLDDN